MGIVLFVASALSIVSLVLAFPQKDIPNVSPQYLDMLLETNQHELFGKLMGIENVNLVRPHEGERAEGPMFHKELRMGDILPRRRITDEESRQIMRLEDVYPGSKWSDGSVPYAISEKYNPDQKKIIEDAIQHWNDMVKCIKLKPWTGETNYVMIFPGDGCYSYMGKTGGQQPVSLDVNGCLWQGTVLHEMEHAVGITHEQNRPDRDRYIVMLWQNIPQEWKSQYEKESTDSFNNHGKYDFYSIMHYPVNAPGTRDPAFKVRSRTTKVDLDRVGNGDDFTLKDIDKINALYC